MRPPRFCRAALLASSLAVLATSLSAGEWVGGFAGEGLNDGVRAVCVFGDDLIAAGDFTTAGGVAASKIARFDGDSWHPLGSEQISGIVTSLAVLNGILYVGGTFAQVGSVPNTAHLASWDGVSWQAVGLGTNDVVNAFYVYHEELIVGGRFTAAGGIPVGGIAGWDGFAWHGYAQGFTEGSPAPAVWAICEWQDQLVVGGRFSAAGATTVLRIAIWDGANWQPVGGGLSGTSLNSVYALTSFNNDLIVGGWFTNAGTVPVHNLARWDGSAWHSIGNGLIDNDVMALAEYENVLYVGGANCAAAQGFEYFAASDGTSLQLIATALDGCSIEDCVAWRSGLVVGGLFQALNGIPAGGVGRWVEAPAWILSVSDVPADQGGMLSADWPAHPADVTGGAPQVSYYEVQRGPSPWTLVELVTAAEADSYRLAFSTPDIMVLGHSPPTTSYRVIARTADPLVNYVSSIVQAYSIDNLPPDTPALSLYDGETYRSLTWVNPAAPDLGESCLYRGGAPGFEAGDPLICSPTQYWYQEDHLALYYYRARSFDIHGNASEWSNEVVGRYPTGVPGAPTVLRLYPNQPNPFNPVTTIRFDVPVGGRVRLEVYDVAGRLIRTLLDAELPAGSHQAVWDGEDSGGRAMASGSYFARLSGAGGVETVRMGLVR